MRKWTVFPRIPCPTCGLTVTADLDGQHVRDHDCPHGHGCEPLRLRKAARPGERGDGWIDVKELVSGTGKIHGCAWCWARVIVVLRQETIEGQPDYLRLIRPRRKRRTDAAQTREKPEGD